jgi:hypothetical protein
MRCSNINDVSTTVHKESYRHIKISKNYISIKIDRGCTYDIHKDWSHTTKEICEWLGQIAEKSWCTPSILGELVMAFNEVNGDLRGMQ